MTWYTWNMRDINKSYKQKELKNYLKTVKIYLVGLVEIRVKQHNAMKILNNIAPGWGFHNNYQEADNGRIWLIWDGYKFSVNLLVVASQMVHRKVTDKTTVTEQLMTIIYWFQHYGAEVILMGCTEYIGPFNQPLSVGSLTFGLNIVSLNHLSRRCGKKQLDNNPMKNIWMKLKALKPLCKKLNKEEFSCISQKIDITRQQLKLVREQIAQHYIDEQVIEEKEAAQVMEKWFLIEESVMRQKSRIFCIKLGDSNTKYFTAVIKERTVRKQIMELNTLAENKITDPKAIRDEIITFYRSLIGTSAKELPAINRLIMQKGPKLTHQQQLALCEVVTTIEIYDSLYSIGDDKAPEVDGYNTVFFIKTWHIIKEGVNQAVYHSSQQGSYKELLIALHSH
ncbi:uncharacterized protein LOC142165728 [Nicotiana tabacum]|uniref:Uncharacterized protein LOC142165728 n=1 Tax=Nicotiana tabacum TaxID=4097 RepID=A0AC58S5C4_TOBAC